jgi:hypothetical protein
MAKIRGKALPKRAGKASGGPARRQTVAKGRRPYFMKDPDVDRLLAMVMALAGEVSVLRDRLDTHERLAAAGKVATPQNIEAYSADEAVEDARETARAAMLSRVFRILSVDMDRGGEADRGYGKLIETFSKR